MLETSISTDSDGKKHLHESDRSFYAYGTGAHASEFLEAHTQLSKFGTKGGTGFAAEDANALNDRLAGHKVDPVGRSNQKNGADRMLNGQPIQTKYFSKASDTVRAAFDEHGVYRYKDMQIEVPSDQYDEAVRLMRERILQGGVPGVTEPSQAQAIVRKGSVTYQQARNIARAGNIDSLKFDAKNGAVLSGYAFAIGFTVNFARCKWNGESTDDALKSSVGMGLYSAGTSFIAGVVTSQLVRTHSARVGTVIARKGVKLIASTRTGRVLIRQIATAAAGKPLKGIAAVNYVSKLLRSNVIAGAVTTVVMTTPDAYRAAIHKNTSWAQVGKNLVVNGVGVAAGTGGWMAGAAGGAAIGSMVPGIGTAAGAIVGGVIGSVAAGWAGAEAGKLAMDSLIRDDADEMREIIESELSLVADEYMLSQIELQKLMYVVVSKCSAEFLREMYGSTNRVLFVRRHFEKEAFEITKEREKVLLPAPIQVRDLLHKIEVEAEFELQLEQKKTYKPNFILVDKTAPIATSIAVAGVEAGLLSSGLPWLSRGLCR